MMAVPKVELNNGQLIPQLGLGSGGCTKESIRDALSFGYRLFDTAEMYKNEEVIGQALAEAIEAGDVKREDLFIVTKVWTNNMSRSRVMPALRGSLERLGLNYVDLYLIHLPCPTKSETLELNFAKTPEFDNDLDIYTETWPAMEECVALGMARSIGVSNFNSQQIDTLVKAAKIRPVVNQVECHPLLSQRKLMDHCDQYGIVIMSYSPLGSTPLSSDLVEAFKNVMNFDVRKALFEHELINKIAAKYGKSVGQVLLRYHMDRGAIAIPKAVTKSRLEQNLQIFDFAFTKDELIELEGLNQNLRFAHCRGLMGDHKNFPFGIEY